MRSACGIAARSERQGRTSRWLAARSQIPKVDPLFSLEVALSRIHFEGYRGGIATA
jgi:hypothetical protein